jgi:hypothetical protein
MSFTVNVGPRMSLRGATGYPFRLVPVVLKDGVDEVYEAGKALERSLKLKALAPSKSKESRSV